MTRVDRMSSQPVLVSTLPHASGPPLAALAPWLDAFLPWHWKTLFSPCHHSAPVIVMLRNGRTMPLYSAPLSMSQRLFCAAAYGSPEAFLQTPALSVALGCQCSTMVPPHCELTSPNGTTVSFFCSMMSVRCSAKCPGASQGGLKGGCQERETGAATQHDRCPSATQSRDRACGPRRETGAVGRGGGWAAGPAETHSTRR